MFFVFLSIAIFLCEIMIEVNLGCRDLQKQNIDFDYATEILRQVWNYVNNQPEVLK